MKMYEMRLEILCLNCVLMRTWLMLLTRVDIFEEDYREIQLNGLLCFDCCEGDRLLLGFIQTR